MCHDDVEETAVHLFFQSTFSVTVLGLAMVSARKYISNAPTSEEADSVIILHGCSMVSIEGDK